MTDVELTADQRDYRRIKRAGATAFWLGVVQLILAPIMAASAIGGSGADRTKLIINYTLVMVVVGVPLVIFGLRMWRTKVGANLARADRARIVMQWVTGGGLFISALTGGRAAIIFTALLIYLYLAGRSVRAIEAGAGTDHR